MANISGQVMITHYDAAGEEVRRIKDALERQIKTIHILDCLVAGTQYRDLADAAMGLHTNDILLLKREPDNEYDPMAVVVISAGGDVLGYLPREKNQIPSHMLDQSQVLFAKVRNKEWKGEWLKLEIRVYCPKLPD